MWGPAMDARRSYSVSSKQERFIALDWLRGVAALVVVAHHIDWPNHLTNIAFVRNGYLAVDCFVICSSYSTKIVSGSGALQFIWLRLFRVYPLHLAVLAAFVVLELAKLWSQGRYSYSRPGTFHEGQFS